MSTPGPASKAVGSLPDAPRKEVPADTASRIGCPPPCAGISAAAARFLAESSSAAWEELDLSPAGVQALRQENSDAAAPGCRAVLNELELQPSDGVVGGVQVQWLAPQQLRGACTLLYFFGGGFVVGSPEDDLAMSARLAAYLGCRVCVPRYRLAPEHPFPAALEDAMAVYRALTGPVALVGESAGGNLALNVVVAAAAEGLPPPMALALFSPWADLTNSGDSCSTLASLDPTLSVPQFLEPASRAYAAGQPRDAARVSPLFAELPAAWPPTLLSSGGRDLLLSDSLRLAGRLRAQGAEVELHVAEGLWHVYEWYPELPEAQASMRAVAAFLRRHLKDEA